MRRSKRERERGESKRGREKQRATDEGQGNDNKPGTESTRRSLL